MSRRVLRDLVLLILLVAPVFVIMAADGLSSGLAVVLALAWLFPVSQLIYSETTAIAFEQFARERLRVLPAPDEALYTDDMIKASSDRFAKRVLGVFRVSPSQSARDSVIGALVRNQFPLDVGSPGGDPITFPPGSRWIGTAETPFLGALTYIHLFALEFFRRLNPKFDAPTLSAHRLPPLIEDDGQGFAGVDPPELQVLDAGLRRVGEWFRNQLDGDPGQVTDTIHALCLFYFAHQAERLRRVLTRSKRDEVPSERDRARFWSVMQRIGVQQPESDPEWESGRRRLGPREEDFYTRRVHDFAHRHSLRAVNPIWVDLASFVPRLALVFLLVAFLHGSEALSPTDLLLIHLQNGGAAVGVGLILLVVGVGGAALSYSAYSTEYVMRPIPWALRRFQRGRGRLWLVAALAAGAVGCTALVPGLWEGEPDLVGMVLPGLAAGLLVIEVIAVAASRVSFLSAMRHYQYRPAVAVGGPRVVVFHFLHYLLFLGLGAWVGKTVVPFLEGHLVEVASWRPFQRPLELVVEELAWAMVMAVALTIGLAAVRFQRGWAVGQVLRSLEILVSVLVAAVLILHRPIGGLVVGGMAVIAALYLAHHSIFMLTVGITALVKSIGRPWRLASLAVPALGLALVSGQTPGWLRLQSGSLLESLGQDHQGPVLAVASRLLFVVVILGLGDAGFAIPTSLAAVGSAVGTGWWGARPCRAAFVLLAMTAVIVRVARWSRTRRERRKRETKAGLDPAVGDLTAVPPCESSGPDRLAVLVTGINPIASLALLMKSSRRATNLLMHVWDELITPNRFPSVDVFLDEDGSRLTRVRVEHALRWTLHQERVRRCSLFGPEAIVVGDRRTAIQAKLEQEQTPFRLVCQVRDEAQAATLRLGLRLIRYLTTRVPCSVAGRGAQVGWSNSQRDTAVYLVQLALALKEAGLQDRVTIYLQANKSTNRRSHQERQANPGDPGTNDLFAPWSLRKVEYDERLGLAAYLRILAGIDCEVTHSHTFDSCKGATQNGHSGSLDAARWAYVLDRNSQCFTLRELINDIRRFTASPEVAEMLPMRSTPNLAFPVGSQAALAEYGFSVFADALVNDLGGDRGEMIGTGWGNLVALPHGEVLRFFADPRLPYRFDPQQRGPARWFGALYGMTNAPHVSEDYVQAICAAEQLKGLGRVPRLEVGEALHYKLREHTSTLEFQNSRQRWSGGGDAGQKGRDPFLQRLRDFGTDSVFVREMQKNRGRYYLLIPLAMLNVLVASTLVITGYAPFTGISVMFWIGLACNQALTLNGLAFHVRRAGPWGGSAIWLSQRLRDILLFPPLVFIEMVGVLTTFSKGDRFGFVFRRSGHLEMGDEIPLAEEVAADTESYGLIASMVATGVLGSCLNLIAIWRLDLGNLLMLYPSLIFIEGLILGAFVYRGQKGPGGSFLDCARWVPKLLGFFLGLIAVVCLALGLGVGRDVHWSDLPVGRAGTSLFAGVPPHVALLAVTTSLVFWMLPLRSALVSPGRVQDTANPAGEVVWGLREWHNLGVYAIWFVLLILAVVLGLGSEGFDHNGLVAAVLFTAVGLAKLARVFVGRIRSPRGRPGRSYARETIRRSAIVTVAATIWFALVPVPAHFSFQFLDYSLSFTIAQVNQSLTIAVVAISLVLLIGALTNLTAWRLLAAYHRLLHIDYQTRLSQGKVAEAIAAVVEAALEGYRVARDTQAPTTAALSLRSLDRALDCCSDSRVFFNLEQSSLRRPVTRRLRWLRILCGG